MTDIQRYLELRSLVDVLYDVQDVRMRTANRLRQMPGETSKLRVSPLLALEKDLTDALDAMLQDEPIYRAFLGKVRGVGPRISGSIIGQTMIRFQRVPAEDYEQMLSHFTDENHSEGASQSSYVTQGGCASHAHSETHTKDASQVEDETHYALASQRLNEIHRRLAYTLEQLRLAQKTENGDYLVPVIRGIGAFPTISSYWAWWGLHVIDGKAPRRKKGENINWNPKMRTLAWKIGKQFVLQGRGYRQIYDQYKDRVTDKRLPLGACPEYEKCMATLKKAGKPSCKGHVDNMAKRYTVKQFISDLWVTWRRLDGLPVSDPWIIAHGGHSKLRDLDEFMRNEEAGA